MGKQGKAREGQTERQRKGRRLADDELEGSGEPPGEMARVAGLRGPGGVAIALSAQESGVKARRLRAKKTIRAASGRAVHGALPAGAALRARGPCATSSPFIWASPLLPLEGSLSSLLARGPHK